VTVPHHGPTVEPETIEEAEAHIREQGMRVSSARRLVLEILFASPRPLSAEEIAEGLDGRLPRSDLASVYRNLETLERLGLVRHFHLGHSPGLYALAARQSHEYLVCDDCGSVLAVEPSELDPIRAAVRERFGFEARFTHFPVVGTCSDCLAGDRKPARRHAHHHHH
jgi:Fur family ferric uptake transcriptional regulator